MSQSVLYLPRRLVHHILHCASAAPNLALLGLVTEVAGRPGALHPIAGGPKTPGQSGVEDESEAVAALIRRLQGQGERAFAICRLHQSTPPQPSPGEVAMAVRFDLRLLIVSLNTKGVLELRGFRPAAGATVVEVELLLEPEGSSR